MTVCVCRSSAWHSWQEQLSFERDPCGLPGALFVCGCPVTLDTIVARSRRAHSEPDPDLVQAHCCFKYFCEEPTSPSFEVGFPEPVSSEGEVYVGEHLEVSWGEMFQKDPKDQDSPHMGQGELKNPC